uniref:Uncharacterized protein n=1 Tax=Anguilla anguilla TaxID=7936 RepID=A0A0E9R3W4_ANGAN
MPDHFTIAQHLYPFVYLFSPIKSTLGHLNKNKTFTCISFLTFPSKLIGVNK